MGHSFDVRWRLPAATMDGPRRDGASLGAIAQLGERLDRTQEVGGSSPPSSISERPCTAGSFSLRRLRCDAARLARVWALVPKRGVKAEDGRPQRGPELIELAYPTAGPT